MKIRFGIFVMLILILVILGFAIYYNRDVELAPSYGDGDGLTLAREDLLNVAQYSSVEYPTYKIQGGGQLFLGEISFSEGTPNFMPKQDVVDDNYYLRFNGIDYTRQAATIIEQLGKIIGKKYYVFGPENDCLYFLLDEEAGEHTPVKCKDGKLIGASQNGFDKADDPGGFRVTSLKDGEWIFSAANCRGKIKYRRVGSNYLSEPL